MYVNRGMTVSVSMLNEAPPTINIYLEEVTNKIRIKNVATPKF